MLLAARYFSMISEEALEEEPHSRSPVEAANDPTEQESEATMRTNALSVNVVCESPTGSLGFPCILANPISSLTSMVKKGLTVQARTALAERRVLSATTSNALSGLLGWCFTFDFRYPDRLRDAEPLQKGDLDPGKIELVPGKSVAR